ncbi:MAG: aldo/keto reductase [Rhizobacter sp.]|nr:aldo/keto reductase [Rhizobacter sp.]
MRAPRLENRRLALGTMAMSGCYGPVSDADSLRTINAFLDLGHSYIDTADLYADGRCEELVGQVAKVRRAQVEVGTKFGFIFGPTAATRGLNADPARVESACDASLRRLGMDCIDVYYLHRVDPNFPVSDTVGAMSRLVERGKVRELGLCEVGPATLDEAVAVHPISVVQTEYSLWSREPETNMLSICAQRGIRFYGYAPLGRGFLTGQIRSPDDIPVGDQRREYPRFKGQNFYRNLLLVDEVRRLAQCRGVSATQLAIAWAIRHSLVTPIVGATTPQQVEEADQAMAIELEEGELAAIEAAFPLTSVAGQRYPDAAMHRLEASSR